MCVNWEWEWDTIKYLLHWNLKETKWNKGGQMSHTNFFLGKCLLLNQWRSGEEWKERINNINSTVNNTNT